MKRFQKAQVSLEVSLAFVAVLFFLLGMMRIWLWSNRDLEERQRDYINTRSATEGRWPVHQTSELNDAILFRGEF